MLTHFGTLFAVCHNYDYLTQLNFTNFVNFLLSCYCFTWNNLLLMFHVERFC
nr:MAG TPA: hypothetical protein [Bacteriophage sp.]